MYIFEGIELFAGYLLRVVAIEADGVVDFEVFFQDLMEALEEERYDRQLNFTQIVNYCLEKLLRKIRFGELIQNEAIDNFSNEFVYIFVINLCKLDISILLLLCMKQLEDLLQVFLYHSEYQIPDQIDPGAALQATL